MLAALSAIGFHPTTVLLRGIVDRVLFGDRADPITAASQVGERLSDDPVLALRALRESMVLPYAALLVGGRTIAASGTAVTSTRDSPGAGGPGGRPARRGPPPGRGRTAALR